MASLLSCSGLQFEENDDKTILIKMVNDETLKNDEKIIAVCIALYYNVITFSKAEEILNESGINVHKAFNGYSKKLKLLDR